MSEIEYVKLNDEITLSIKNYKSLGRQHSFTKDEIDKISNICSYVYELLPSYDIVMLGGLSGKDKSITVGKVINTYIEIRYEFLPLEQDIMESYTESIKKHLNRKFGVGYCSVFIETYKMTIFIGQSALDDIKVNESKSSVKLNNSVKLDINDFGLEPRQNDKNNSIDFYIKDKKIGYIEYYYDGTVYSEHLPSQKHKEFNKSESKNKFKKIKKFEEYIIDEAIVVYQGVNYGPVYNWKKIGQGNGQLIFCTVTDEWYDPTQVQDIFNKYVIKCRQKSEDPMYSSSEAITQSNIDWIMQYIEDED